MVLAIDWGIVHRTTVRLTPLGLERLKRIKAKREGQSVRHIVEHGLYLYDKQLKGYESRDKKKKEAAQTRREGEHVR